MTGSSGNRGRSKRPAWTDPCPCGSGRSYEKCCGEAAADRAERKQIREMTGAVIAEFKRIGRELKPGSPEYEEAERNLRAGIVPPMTDRDRADGIIHDARRAYTDRRYRLAQEALDLWPDCSEAYLILAERVEFEDQAIDLYEKAVDAAHRVMIADGFFESEAGSFSTYVVGRAYLRARSALAGSLWQVGREEEAVEHYADMLRLDVADSEKNRLKLLLIYLFQGKGDLVEALLAQFLDDSSAAWLYGGALHYFKAADREKAGAWLARALTKHRGVIAYLLEEEEFPEKLPRSEERSEESKCATEQLELWAATPGAREWLREASGGNRKKARNRRARN